MSIFITYVLKYRTESTYAVRNCYLWKKPYYIYYDIFLSWFNNSCVHLEEGYWNSCKNGWVWYYNSLIKAVIVLHLCSFYRLRFLSGNAGNSELPKYELADYRYGREEMLALFDKNAVAPESLSKIGVLFVANMQLPLALMPMSDEEIVSLWF